MGLHGEQFRGNPHRLDEVEDDEIEYFLEDEETIMFGPQYMALDIALDSDVDDDDDDLFIPEEESLIDSDDDISDIDVIIDSETESNFFF